MASVDERVSRRRLLKRAGVGAAVLGAGSMLTASSAAAQDGDPHCVGAGGCGPCDPARRHVARRCGCIITTHGCCFCHQGISCSDRGAVSRRRRLPGGLGVFVLVLYRRPVLPSALQWRPPHGSRCRPNVHGWRRRGCTRAGSLRRPRRSRSCVARATSPDGSCSSGPASVRQSSVPERWSRRRPRAHRRRSRASTAVGVAAARPHRSAAKTPGAAAAGSRPRVAASAASPPSATRIAIATRRTTARQGMHASRHAAARSVSVPAARATTSRSAATRRRHTLPVSRPIWAPARQVMAVGTTKKSRPRRQATVTASSNEHAMHLERASSEALSFYAT